MLQTHVLARIALLITLGVTTAGCELVGGIFKAGVWVGALAVITIVLLVVVAVAKMRR